MFAIPGIVALLFLVYVRPQDIFPALQAVPLLYVACLLAVVGWAVDTRLKLNQPRLGALVVLAVLHAGWAMVTLLSMSPAALVSESLLSLIGLFLFLAAAYGPSGIRGVRVIAVTVLGLGLVISTVALHQSVSPMRCVTMVEGDTSVLVPDDRTCQTTTDCYRTDLGGSDRYRCERVGLLGTTTITGRVRYRGVLQDPNEMSLVLAAMLPFAWVLFETRRSLPSFGLAMAATLSIGTCVFLSQSRSGQLALVAVLAVYFFRRYRVAGILPAAMVAVPFLILGWRSGDDATTSSDRRLVYWHEAMKMAYQNPVFGVGKGQFTEHFVQTAHNSFLLALAERGALGMIIWSLAMYVAVKIAWRGSRITGDDAGEGRAWSVAMLASLLALLAGSFFLSFIDHHMLWIHLGLTAALAAALARHRPGFTVRLGFLDVALVVAADVVIVAGIRVFSYFKGV